MDPNGDLDPSDHLEVINLSIGVPVIGNPDDAFSQAVDNAVRARVVAAVAAGNYGNGSRAINSPGCARKALTVGTSARSNDQEIADFSSRGPMTWTGQSGSEWTILKPNVVAPGVDICAAKATQNNIEAADCVDSSHLSLSGTSMATPHVAGIAALVRHLNPSWTSEEVQQAIINGAIPLLFRARESGHGRVSAPLAIRHASPPPTVFIEQISTQVELNKTIVIESRATSGLARLDLEIVTEDVLTQPNPPWVSLATLPLSGTFSRQNINVDMHAFLGSAQIFRATVTDLRGVQSSSLGFVALDVAKWRWPYPGLITPSGSSIPLIYSSTLPAFPMQLSIR